MKLPFFRVPSRDARDADHLALMLVAGGIYFLSGQAGWAAPVYLWMMVTSGVAIVGGLLLWSRMPHAKWFGFLVALSIVALTIRHVFGRGLAVGDILSLVGSGCMAYWFVRIDYTHRFSDSDGWI